MDSFVNFQNIWSSKSFTILVTFIWFLYSVTTFMYFKRTGINDVFLHFFYIYKVHL